MVEFESGGRRVSQKAFFRALRDKGIKLAMEEIARRAHGRAASLVDPETDRHADVFVRPSGELQLELATTGSPTFAIELDRRLSGTLPETAMTIAGSETTPKVYLAHASEDHDTLAAPLARALMQDGIEVWFDEWEIATGDSIRQRMDAGLSTMTHFVVLLTQSSLHKPWVEKEIDVGFIRAVGGQSRFMGLRVGVGLEDLSPFLATLRCPEIDLKSPEKIAGLVADIYGISRKPPRGGTPRYVRTVPNGITGWSISAQVVAEFLVHSSKNGMKFDPQTSIEKVAEATGLPIEDVRLGVLDLKESGLVEESREIRSTAFWPTASLFPEFDRYFLDFDPRLDAIAVATWLLNQEKDRTETAKLAAGFPDWAPRRLNSALSFLEGGRIVQASQAIGSKPWNMVAVRVDDRTRRFVRDNR